MLSMSIIQNEDIKGTVSRKRAAADALARRRAQDSLYVAIIMGMVVLFVTVMALVMELAPDTTTDPNFINLWLKSHQARLYFIEAKSLVKPFIKTSVEKWSCAGFDKNCVSIELGNGVWYAAGTVDTRSNDGVTTHQSWGIYFLAETATPLFTKVGDVESGNLTEALRLAQSNPSTDQTAVKAR
jgi:hypothetical protein